MSFQKKLAEKDWLAMAWPKEYGGGGASHMRQLVYNEEMAYHQAPVGNMGIAWVGPSLMLYGTDEQKEKFIPRITQADDWWCTLYSEPGAGSDLASLQTRATRDGDDYVINGQKIWTSLASDADYVWLAARTDPKAAKHAGISMFVVDMKTPGINVQPMELLSMHDIAIVQYENVRVPARQLVGGENRGWKLITSQLNHERVTLCSAGLLEQSFEGVRRFALDTKRPDGRRVIDQEWVRMNLARVWSGLQFIRLLNWKVAWQGTQGRLDVADASSLKVFGTEWYMQSFRLLMEVLGPRAYLQHGSPEALLRGRLETNYRSLLILTFGGGTNEIQRDLIGLFGLRLPRIPRM
jgi:alkylation response protein AidB-like acyl-CoA dehydrogenase